MEKVVLLCVLVAIIGLLAELSPAPRAKHEVLTATHPTVARRL